MNAQKGFTLIELMIVVAIVGILAAIAIPAYQNYIARAQMAEALTLASAQKSAVAEYFGNKGAYPTDNSSAGIPTDTSISGTYVAKVNVSDSGTIVAKMKSSGLNANIINQTLTLTPKDNGGSISWGCTSSADKKYLPTICQ